MLSTTAAGHHLSLYKVADTSPWRGGTVIALEAQLEQAALDVVTARELRDAATDDAQRAFWAAEAERYLARGRAIKAMMCEVKQ